MERSDLTARMSAAGARLERLLRSLGRGEVDRPVEGLDWTVGDTAAHVITVLRRGLGDRRRSADADGVARLNQASIDELAERDPSRLADLLAADVAATVERAIPKYPLDLEVPFHGGGRVRLDLAWGVVLGELLVHGHDIATGTGRPWRIERAEAATAWRGAAGVAPVWLRPGAGEGPEESWRFHLDDGDPPVVFRRGGGRVTVGTEPAGEADHELRIDPATLLLGFPFNRRPVGHPAVARLAALFLPP